MANGVLDQFGIKTQEEILAERRDRAIQNANSAAAAASPRTRQAARTGSMISSLLSSKFGGGTKDEKAALSKAEVAQRATAKFEEFRNERAAGSDTGPRDSGGNISHIPMSPEEERIKYQEMLADEFAQAGDVDTSLTIANQAANERKLLEQQNMQQKQAGIRLETSELALEEAKRKANEPPKVGEVKTIYPLDSEHPAARTGVAAVVKPDGTADAGQAGTFNRGGWSHQRNPNLKTSASIDDRVKSYRMITTPTERAANVNALRSTAGLLDASIEMANILQEAETLGGGDVNILGKAGVGTRFIGKLIQDANSGVRVALGLRDNEKIEPVEIRDEDGTLLGTLDGTAAKTKKFLHDNPDYFEEMDIPEQFRRSKDLSAAWQTAAVNMTYAKMRKDDPRAKGFSDFDFKSQSKVSGKDVSSPEEFRRIARVNADTAIREFQWRLDTTRDEFKDIAFGSPKALERYQETVQRYRDIFGTEASFKEFISEDPTAVGGTGGGSEEVLTGESLDDWLSQFEGSYID